MKCAVVREFGQPLVIEDRPIPGPGPGRVAVRMEQNTGYSVDGGFAEYFTADAAFAAPVPDGIDPIDAAPLSCAGVTRYKAVKVGNVRSGDLVAISGIGGLGHLALQ
ncbi:MAG: alcohol dehydrogenase [Actinomycetia bacterium]|nr:alcohol dehydrogenase [Actinomycetes bacterium]